VTSTNSCKNILEYFLTFYFANTIEEGTGNRGLIQLVVDYLIIFLSLLHSSLLIFTVWLIIMAKVCHYRSSQIFFFHDIYNLGLWQDCFDRGVFEHLKKYIGRHRGVAGCSFR
jgi:hypothetical protein